MCGVAMVATPRMARRPHETGAHQVWGSKDSSRRAARIVWPPVCTALWPTTSYGIRPTCASARAAGGGSDLRSETLMPLCVCVCVCAALYL